MAPFKHPCLRVCSVSAVLSDPSKPHRRRCVVLGFFLLAIIILWDSWSRTAGLDTQQGVEPYGYRHILSWSPVVETGNLWYRYGTPFKPIPLRHVAFRFNAASVSNTSLLFYAQLLSGVFRASREQYIALILSNGRVTMKSKRSAADGGRAEMLNLPNQIKPKTWYVACISLVPTPKLAVHALEKIAGKDTQGTWESCEWESNAAGYSPNIGTADSSSFIIDSGLYFGAVVDVRNSPGLSSEPGLGAFHGGIVSSFLLNQKEVNLDAESQGPPTEKWESYLSHLDLTQPIIANLTKGTTPLNDVSFQKFPVVSATSENHASEIQDMLSSAVQIMPTRGIIVYEMGLRGKSVEEIRSFCNVTIRSYRRDLFPKLLSNMFHYRWKAPLVYGAFLEFGGLIWADASVRFKYLPQHLPLVRDGYGFVGFTEPGDSPVGSFTHNGTLRALGVDRSFIQLSDTTIGGLLIWLGRGGVCKVALEHWVRCAFVKECMAPEGARHYYKLCRMKEKPFGNFIGCHLFDQVAISIIMAKIYSGQRTSQYLTKTHLWVDLKRRPTTMFPRCSTNASSV